MDYETFRSRFGLSLNPQQEAAVRQEEGPALLLAVPGSGKTTVIVARLGYLLYCKGVDPASILTVTYTVAATRDMKERFRAVFGDEYADAMAFRTINGICDTIIRTYARIQNRTPFTLVSRESELSALVRGLLMQGGMEHPNDQQVKEARTLITYAKNGMLTEAELDKLELEGVDFPSLFRAYKDHMNAHRLMDFDDQMVIAHQILRKYPDILARLQERYRYLNVDEAQDTSKIQHAILRLLAAGHHNIFMVGDEDQSIYGFRAAYPQALLEFDTLYPEARVLLMETNYRSTRAIVEKADEFIQRNRDRRPKHMRTDNPRGREVRRTKFTSYSRQYDYLAKVAADPGCRTGVLYRNNDSALPLIDLLEQRGLPYSCRQRESFFFTSPVVRDVTEILAFAWQEEDETSFLNFYYKLDLKLKRVMVQAALRDRPADVPVLEHLIGCGAFEGWQLGKLKALQTHFSKLPSLTSYAALQRIVKYMGYGDYLKERQGDNARLGVLLSLAEQTQDPLAFLRRLRQLQAVVEEGHYDPDCLFQLSTIHASKGLEYDRVILMDVLNGQFPAVEMPHGEEELEEEERKLLEEERRLFYVGITRARERLELFTYQRRFGEQAQGSLFIDQLLGPEEPTASGSVVQKAAWKRPEEGGQGLEGFAPGISVTHKAFGAGLLLHRNGSIATIRFAQGEKKLDLSACLKKKLIRIS